MLGSGNSKIEYEEEYVSTLSRKIENAHELARKHLKNSQKRQKQDYDVNLRQYRYEPGDLVYERNSSSKLGACLKLQKIWKGPLLVVRLLSLLLYVVRYRKRDRVVHHDRLKDRTKSVWMLKLRNNFFEREEGDSETNDETEIESQEESLGLDKLFREPRTRCETLGNDTDKDESLQSSLDVVPKVTQRGRLVKVPIHLKKDYVC